MPLRPTGRCKPEYRDKPHTCGAGCAELEYVHDPLVHTVHLIVDGQPIAITVKVDIDKIIRMVKHDGLEFVQDYAIISDFVELEIKGDE